MVSLTFISTAALALAGVVSAAPVAGNSADVASSNSYNGNVGFDWNHYGQGGRGNGGNWDYMWPDFPSHPGKQKPGNGGNWDYMWPDHPSKPGKQKPGKGPSNPAPSPGKGGKGGSSGTDQKTILEVHNKYRAKHQAPPLKWSSKLAEHAQNWSNGCVFQHSQTQGMGENLAWNYDSWNSVIKGWYDEVKDYDYQSGSFSMATGHFTQVVWKGTTEVGCGVAKCPDGPIYTCNYSPPGNMMGDFQNNVLPPK